MNNFSQLIAFGAGTFCLGAAVTIGMIFALASRHSGQDNTGSCFGTFLVLAALAMASFFFVIAIPQ